MADKSSKGNRSIRKSVKKTAEQVPLLKSFTVEGLYGKYSFLDIALQNAGTDGNLTLLYGENGVGKTTILRLIFSLLSTQVNDGNRGFLAQTKFKKVSVSFDDGQLIAAERDESTTGGYDYVFRGPRHTARYPISVRPEGNVAQADNKHFDEYMAALEKISPILVFVNDNRSIRSTNDDWDIRSKLVKNLSRRNYAEIYTPEFDLANDLDKIVSKGLERLLDQAFKEIRDRAFALNSRANTHTGQVYLNVARAITRTRGSAGASQPDPDGLKHRLNLLVERIEAISGYNLIHGDYAKEILRTLSEGRKVDLIQLFDILEPYVASLEQRVSAATPLAEQMDAFSNSVNTFFRRKKIVLNLDSSFSISDDDGVEISPQSLSSGERHLLYLSLVAMLARDKSCVVLVDEPELSLNFKWQRELISNLLEVAGKETQFIMATHAFEIISSHRESIVVLEPQLAAT